MSAQWRSAGPVADVPQDAPAGHRWDRDDGQRVEVVLVQRDDTVYALSSRCPHRGAPLDTLGMLHPEEPQLICRWHYWAFNLEDGAHTTLDGVGLCRYPVKIEAGEVFVNIGETLAGNPGDAAYVGCD